MNKEKKKEVDVCGILPTVGKYRTVLSLASAVNHAVKTSYVTTDVFAYNFFLAKDKKRGHDDKQSLISTGRTYDEFRMLQ